MAVLVEGISVIIRRNAIIRAFGPSWQTFVDSVPNQTLCADPELARVGFMDPRDVEAYVETLEKRGVRYLRNGVAVDLAVVDQVRGPAAPCDWLETGHVEVNGNSIAAARLAGSTVSKIALPEGWTFELSLSARFGVVPTNDVAPVLEAIGQSGGLDVYRDRETGEKVYIGRTHRGIDPPSPHQEAPGKPTWFQALRTRITGRS